MDMKWLPALIAVGGMFLLWRMWSSDPRDDGLGPSRGIVFAVILMCVACIVFRIAFGTFRS